MRFSWDVDSNLPYEDNEGVYEVPDEVGEAFSAVEEAARKLGSFIFDHPRTGPRAKHG